MQPEQSPFAVFARYGEDAPVDLDAIARDLAIPVSYLNLGSDVAGQIMRDSRKSPKSGFVIWVNVTQHPNRQRFTLAHELAHFTLHRDLIESGLVDDTMYRSTIGGHFETQANRLAAEILMPTRLIK